MLFSEVSVLMLIMLVSLMDITHVIIIWTQMVKVIVMVQVLLFVLVLITRQPLCMCQPSLIIFVIGV